MKNCTHIHITYWTSGIPVIPHAPNIIVAPKRSIDVLTVFDYGTCSVICYEFINILYDDQYFVVVFFIAISRKCVHFRPIALWPTLDDLHYAYGCPAPVGARPSTATVLITQVSGVVLMMNRLVHVCHTCSELVFIRTAASDRIFWYSSSTRKN